SDNHAATMQRVLAGVIPPVSAKVPDLPPRLDDLLKKALMRDPAQRFGTARDMALEIEQCVAPALASEVGTWVEAVARATLVARAAKVQEMEAESAAAARTTAGSAAPASRPPPGQLPGLVAPRAMYAEQAAVNLPPEDLEDDVSGSLLRPPGGRNAVPQRASDGSIRWKPRDARQPPAG